MTGVWQKGADLSDDGLYRYCLWRRWGPGDSMVFVMLNPSVADHTVDDPTTTRCINFAKREGLGGLEIINLYALRATKPVHLRDHPEPEGRQNPEAWDQVLAYFHRGPIVAGWGVGQPPEIPSSRALLRADTSKWLCLGHTKNGLPRHPLFLPAETKLIPL
jgi:hypothetical protein